MKTKNSRISSSYKVINFVTISIFIMFFIFSNKVIAQKNWSATFKVGANFPTSKLGDANLKTGFGFEGTIAYEFVPKLAVYAGWGWNKFNSDKLFLYNNIDVVETGYRFGLQYAAPIGTSNLKYLIAAGGLYNHIEIENSNGNLIEDSGHGFGFEVEGGVIIPLSDRFNFTPTVRYHSLNRELKNGILTEKVNLNYISVGLGISYVF
jgi:Outer membrane protein beta-barrel domain